MFMAAPHSRGKVAVDKIFGAGGKAQQAIQKFGRAKVINGSQGVLLDESENFVCLPTVEKVLRSLSVTDMAAYAPIRGLPEFLNDVIDGCGICPSFGCGTSSAGFATGVGFLSVSLKFALSLSGFGLPLSKNHKNLFPPNQKLS